MKAKTISLKSITFYGSIIPHSSVWNVLSILYNNQFQLYIKTSQIYNGSMAQSTLRCLCQQMAKSNIFLRTCRWQPTRCSSLTKPWPCHSCKVPRPTLAPWLASKDWLRAWSTIRRHHSSNTFKASTCTCLHSTSRQWPNNSRISPWHHPECQEEVCSSNKRLPQVV